MSHDIQEFIKEWKDSDPQSVKDDNVEQYLGHFAIRAQNMRDDLEQNGIQSGDFNKVMFNFSRSYDDVRIIASELNKLCSQMPD